MEELVCLRIIELGILALAYEWWAVYSGRWNMTISALILTEVEKGRFTLLTVGFIVGVLVGHFCWPQVVYLERGDDGGKKEGAVADTVVAPYRPGFNAVPDDVSGDDAGDGGTDPAAGLGGPP